MPVTIAARPAALPPAVVRALRGPKESLSPWRHQGVVVEPERRRDRTRTTATVFLTGAECPYTCVFCDLWRHTLDGATPPGAVPAQLRDATELLRQRGEKPEHLKLYNASNYFEPRAVPEIDDAAVLELLAPFALVTVECHPRLVLSRRGRARCAAFAEGLAGRLEVAMGLETVHPRAAVALGKDSDAAVFGAACEALRSLGACVRAFVLVGAPYVPAAEQVDWTVRSTRAAAEMGASVISLVPVRGGNGALERVARDGELAPVTLRLVETCYERALAEVEPEFPEAAVLLDTWDLESLAGRAPGTCPDCTSGRALRLREMSLSGVVLPGVRCGCDEQATAAGSGLP